MMLVTAPTLHPADARYEAIGGYRTGILGAGSSDHPAAARRGDARRHLGEGHRAETTVNTAQSSRSVAGGTHA